MDQRFDPTRKIGVLGGGQLGKMLQQAGSAMDLNLHFLDPNPEASVSGVTPNLTTGSFSDKQTVLDFAKDMDVVTVEIEHVSVEALEELEAAGKVVAPSSKILRIVQDKGLQKQFYTDHGIPTSPYELVSDAKDWDWSDFKPMVQKMRKGGYDGKGVKVVRTEADLNDLLPGPSVMEQPVDIDKELSVIVARNASGEVSAFPVVELEFDPEANLVDLLFSPARVSPDQAREAKNIAVSVAEKLELVGVLAVEMFLNKEGEILVNEVAPRPHNSGHQTIEGNYTSQYQQHLRAILDLPLGDPSILAPNAMVNILGTPGKKGNVIYQGMDDVLKLGGVYPHIYGKKQTSPFRKMGHVTVVADSVEAAIDRAKTVRTLLTCTSKD